MSQKDFSSLQECGGEWEFRGLGPEQKESNPGRQSIILLDRDGRGHIHLYQHFHFYNDDIYRQRWLHPFQLCRATVLMVKSKVDEMFLICVDYLSYWLWYYAWCDIWRSNNCIGK